MQDASISFPQSPTWSALSTAPKGLESGGLAVFDDVDEWMQFSRACDGLPAHEGTWQSQMRVQGMHCANCAETVEGILSALQGVLTAQVSAATGRASITWSAAQTKPSRWMAASMARGYPLLPAADSSESLALQQESRLALWRWLVAGFCMMQVMMYATPAYFAAQGEISKDIVALLRWASWVLTLPVVFFSCGPFFKQALRDLRLRSINMDLPVAIGIVITFTASTVATFDPVGRWGEQVYFDSLTMFVFFLLTGRWLEVRLRARTAGALGQLMQRLPQSVERLLVSGEFEPVAVRRLMVDDVVRVLPGQAFPADGTITLGDTFTDEALLTGESRPVQRLLGAPVMAGSFNISHAVQVKITQIGQDTRYAQIIALMGQAALEKPRLALMADRIAKPFLWAVLLGAAGAAAYWWSTDPARGLMAAVAVLIVTCPCALSLATPTAMLTSAGWLAKRGVLVRRLQAMEALSKVDHVVFDKTGTLTEPAMELVHIETRTGFSEMQVLPLAQALSENSLHPVSRVLSHLPMRINQPKVAVNGVQEFAGQGLQGDCDPSSGLAIVNPVRLGSAKFCHLDNAEGARLQVFLSDANGYIAKFELDEKLRTGAQQAIGKLQKMGVQVQILSGDRQASVDALACALGNIQGLGGCTPDSKLALMQTLQAAGHTVMMVGDGLNDGPVLAQAHVSVAIGDAVPLAQSQSDFVVPGGHIQMLPDMLVQAKRTMRVVKQNLLWAALYNAACVPLALIGWLPPWLAGLGMATSSLVVLGNASRLMTVEETS